MIRSSAAVAVLLVLRESQAPSFVLRYRLGLDGRRINALLAKLRRAGMVERDEKGFWRLTEEGRRYADSLAKALGVRPDNLDEVIARLIAG